MELWERIARARKAAGLSQEELGVRLGVSRQAVSKWETGQTKPDLDTIILMCRELDLSADYLLLGAEKGAFPAEHAQAEEPPVLSHGTYALVLTQCSNTDGCAQAFLMKNLVCSPTAAKELLDNPPVILFRDLDEKEAEYAAYQLRLYNCSVKLVQSHLAATLEDALDAPPIFLPYRDPKKPMSFGMTVLAVALGVVGALLLLSIF